MDFHILTSSGVAERLHYACRLTEKAWRQGCRVYLRAESGEQAAELDTLLWTFRDRSFVPHRLDAAGGDPEPVLVGTGDGPEAADPDVLVNLAPEPAPEPALFNRVVEITDSDPAVRDAARQRFRWYREQGYQPEHLQVRS